MTPDVPFNAGAIRPIECVREAWQLIKSDYWVLFAISLIGAMVAGVTLYVLLGGMICGIMGCYLKRIDGGNVKFEDLWLGMKFFVPSIPVVLLFVVPIVIYVVTVFLTLYSPLITLAVMGESVDPSMLFGTFAAALLIDLAIAIAMTCVHSLIVFAFPLMIDRGLGPVDAIKLSARAAWNNVGGITGLILIQLGLILVGGLMFCIGIYLMIPILTATTMVAYRKVFPLHLTLENG